MLLQQLFSSGKYTLKSKLRPFNNYSSYTSFPVLENIFDINIVQSWFMNSVSTGNMEEKVLKAMPIFFDFPLLPL